MGGGKLGGGKVGGGKLGGGKVGGNRRQAVVQKGIEGAIIMFNFKHNIKHNNRSF